MNEWSLKAGTGSGSSVERSEGEEYDAGLEYTGGRGVKFGIETDPAFPGQFRVRSSKIETMVRMTNWEYFEATARFERVLEATGVIAALEERGAVEGDLIMIADLDFDYSPKKNKYIPQELLDRDERWARQTSPSFSPASTSSDATVQPIELDGSADDGDDDDDDDDDYVFNPDDFDMDFSDLDLDMDGTDDGQAVGGGGGAFEEQPAFEKSVGGAAGAIE